MGVKKKHSVEKVEEIKSLIREFCADFNLEVEFKEKQPADAGEQVAFKHSVKSKARGPRNMDLFNLIKKDKPSLTDEEVWVKCDLYEKAANPKPTTEKTL